MTQVGEKVCQKVGIVRGLQGFSSAQVQLNDEDHRVLPLQTNRHPAIAF